MIKFDTETWWSRSRWTILCPCNDAAILVGGTKLITVVIKKHWQQLFRLPLSDKEAWKETKELSGREKEINGWNAGVLCKLHQLQPTELFIISTHNHDAKPLTQRHMNTHTQTLTGRESEREWERERERKTKRKFNNTLLNISFLPLSLIKWMVFQMGIKAKAWKQYCSHLIFLLDKVKPQSPSSNDLIGLQALREFFNEPRLVCQMSALKWAQKRFQGNAELLQKELFVFGRLIKARSTEQLSPRYQWPLYLSLIEVSLAHYYTLGQYSCL